MLYLHVKTPGSSAQICDLLQDKLGIEPSRVYIEFAAPVRTMSGWDRTTF